MNHSVEKMTFTIILLFYIHCRQTNVMDNMLAIMEQYSAQLEVKVAEETESLVTEKQKTEQLLLKMLPR